MRLLLACLLALMPACTDRPVSGDAHRPVSAARKSGNQPWYARYVESSPTVADYEDRIEGDAVWVEREVSEDRARVDVGEDREDHFTVGVSLRIHRDGSVYIAAPDGEWVKESGGGS